MSSRAGREHPAPDLLRALEEDVLPGEVAGEVRAHLERCVICEQLLQDLLHPALADPSLADVERLQQRVRAGTAPRGLRTRHFALAGSAAAAVLIGLWLGRPGPRVAPRPAAVAVPVAVNYRLALQPAPLRLPLASALILRGQQDPAADDYLRELGTALEPYRAGHFGDAVARLETLAGRYPRAVEPPFYLGVARLMNGDAPGALEPLRKARQIGGEALNDDIAWYLAVALERTGAWPSATPLLESLCGGEGNYRAAACGALGR